jgi:uncharacterized membrane protein
MLCYIPRLGWIASVILLSSGDYKSHPYIRFHAFQGLFLSAVDLVVQFVFLPYPVFPFGGFGRLTFAKLLQLAVFAAQVVGIIKTVQGERYRLPLLGELADKSMV